MSENIFSKHQRIPQPKDNHNYRSRICFSMPSAQILSILHLNSPTHYFSCAFFTDFSSSLQAKATGF